MAGRQVGIQPLSHWSLPLSCLLCLCKKPFLYSRLAFSQETACLHLFNQTGSLLQDPILAHVLRSADVLHAYISLSVKTSTFSLECILMDMAPACVQVKGENKDVQVKRLPKRPMPPRFGRKLTNAQKELATHICVDCGWIYCAKCALCISFWALIGPHMLPA